VRTRAGFTVVELVVATAILLALTGGLLAIVGPGSSGAKARAAAIEMQQRLRAAVEAVGADLAAAGTGPVNGVGGQPFGAVTASLLPFRVGTRGDPAGTVRSDVLTVLASPGVVAAAQLADAWTPGGDQAHITTVPGCPAGDVSCGFRAEAVVLLLDGRGQADLYRVTAVAGSLLTLEPRGATSGRAFPAGSVVVPVGVVTYSFKPGGLGEAGQLVSGDGDSADMPLADHVTTLSFQLFGEPRAPVLTTATGARRATYGPLPPSPADDDPKDAWPAGENCTFVAAAVGQVGRLPALHPGTGLVPLSQAMLADGPWCPDAIAPSRFDADLLRVRAVRVTIRFEAASMAARGSDAGLFARPGTSADRSSAAADREVVFDVVPRALLRGR
jgi:type II secretory pathway pseudopilin PulG